MDQERAAVNRPIGSGRWWKEADQGRHSMAMLTADEPLGLAPEKGAIPRRRLLVPLVIVVVGLGAWAGYLSRKYPTASPLTSTAYLVQQIGHPHAQMQRQVIGFLPYWQQDDSKFVPLNLLSEVVFFALTADDHGQIVTEKDGKPEPGWRAWRSSPMRNGIARTQIAGSKFVLSVAQQDGVQLGALLQTSKSGMVLQSRQSHSRPTGSGWHSSCEIRRRRSDSISAASGTQSSLLRMAQNSTTRSRGVQPASPRIGRFLRTSRFFRTSDESAAGDGG